MRKKRKYSDFYSTDGRVITEIARYIPLKCKIWEPANGEGNVSNFFRNQGHKVLASDYYDICLADCHDKSCPTNAYDEVHVCDFTEIYAPEFYEELEPGYYSMANEFIKDVGGLEVFDIIVTGPPFSKKEKFVRACCELDKPFALLLPITAIKNGILEMCREYDLQYLYCGKRPFNHFCAIPSEKLRLKLDVLWLCRGLLPSQVCYHNFLEASKIWKERRDSK